MGSSSTLVGAILPGSPSPRALAAMGEVSPMRPRLCRAEGEDQTQEGEEMGGEEMVVVMEAEGKEKEKEGEKEEEEDFLMAEVKEATTRATVLQVQRINASFAKGEKLCSIHSRAAPKKVTGIEWLHAKLRLSFVFIFAITIKIS